MTDGFLQALKSKKEVVWSEIEDYFQCLLTSDNLSRISNKYNKLVDFHKEIVEEYPRRQGKYLRPSLVILTAEAMGIDNPKNAIKTAAAMQVSEDWLLIHDDVQDSSLERRGKPALHRLYSKELAVNAGDALHILMWKILFNNLELVGYEKGIRIFNEFYAILARTALGQTVEIKWTQENKLDLKDEDVLFILEGKTGYYTVAGPLRLGAILAGANEEQLSKLYQFGILLGYCFQIKDDLLDLTSDFDGLKKQQGNDIYEGKRTIMLMHLLRNAKGKDADKLKKIFEKSREDKTEKEVEFVINLMKKYGSLNYGKKMTQRYAKEAENYFEENLDFLSEQPARTHLKSFINFVVTRTH